MKKNVILLAVMALMMSVTACGNKNTVTAEAEKNAPMEWEKFAFNDSTANCTVEVSGELPVAKDSVSTLMRDSLLAILTRNINYSVNHEDGSPAVKPYSGDTDNLQSVIDYYCKAVVADFEKQGKDNRDESIKYIEEDSTLTEEEKQQQISQLELMQFGYSVTMKRDSTETIDSLYILVYDDEYGYWGGAHGGVCGDGTITFLRETGQRVTDWFKPNQTKAMQSLLKKGLKEYFSENDEPVKTDEELFENLQIMDEDGNFTREIPLPQQYVPYPTKEGLVFVYAQYEIACYAAGMPCFTVSWKDLKPFLK